MKRILTLILAVMLVLLVAVACTKPEEPHTHSATKTEQVDATCTASGVKAYWYCAGCTTYFSDAACTAKIDSIDAWKTGAGKIAAKGHTATKTEQVDATATTDGVKAYWTCSVCKVCFSDEACTTKIDNIDAWKTGDGKIPATGEAPEAPKNEGALKAGIYKSTFSVAMGQMTMNFDISLTLKADNTFVMTDATGAEKGAGTWALTGDCYTLTFAADKTTTFVVKANGSLQVTSRLHYGSNGFDIESVEGGITFTFDKEIPAPHTHSATKTEQVNATCTTTGVKAYWYCAGCNTYFSDEACTAKIENLDAWKAADGKIAAKGHTATKTEQVDATATTDGVKPYWYCAACTTYFSDEACTAKIENLDAWKTGDGKIPATGAPEVTYTIAAGTYVGTIEKTAMGSALTYYYNVTIGADGTFSYFVKFVMGGNVHDGATASGTYTVEGNVFTFTPAEGEAIVGELTANDTLKITLKGSPMATKGDEVTLTAGDHVIPEIPVDPNPDQPGEGGGETPDQPVPGDDDIVPDEFAPAL